MTPVPTIRLDRNGLRVQLLFEQAAVGIFPGRDVMHRGSSVVGNLHASLT